MPTRVTTNVSFVSWLPPLGLYRLFFFCVAVDDGSDASCSSDRVSLDRDSSDEPDALSSSPAEGGSAALGTLAGSTAGSLAGSTVALLAGSGVV